MNGSKVSPERVRRSRRRRPPTQASRWNASAECCAGGCCRSSLSAWGRTRGVQFSSFCKSLYFCENFSQFARLPLAHSAWLILSRFSAKILYLVTLHNVNVSWGTYFYISVMFVSLYVMPYFCLHVCTGYGVVRVICDVFNEHFDASLKPFACHLIYSVSMVMHTKSLLQLTLSWECFINKVLRATHYVVM